MNLFSVEMDNEMFGKPIGGVNEEGRLCSIIIVDLNSKEIPLKVSHHSHALLYLTSLSF